MEKRHGKQVDVSIIIINYNTADLTLQCIKSLVLHTENINYEIIVVDNASNDGFAKTLPIVKKQLSKNLRGTEIFLIRNDKNLGFSGANNQGLAKAKGRYVLLLNSDTIIVSNVVGEVCSWMDEHDKCGVSSCQLYNKDGSIQGSGGYFPIFPRLISWLFMIDDIPFLDRIIKPFHPNHQFGLYKGIKRRSAIQLDWLTGAFMFIRREVYLEIGGLDNDYFMYVEDLDFCFRAKKHGWEIWLLPQLGITHLGGASSSSEYPLVSEFKSLQIFYKKHLPSWQVRTLPHLFRLASVLRMFVLGILGGSIKSLKIYAKTFKSI